MGVGDTAALRVKATPHGGKWGGKQYQRFSQLDNQSILHGFQYWVLIYARTLV